MSSSPASLRIVLTWWMQVEDAALELELGVERGVERDRHAVVAATAQPSRPPRSTSTSSRLELVAGDAERAVAELLEARPPAAPRAPRAAPRRASARAPAGSA